jgi:hypothetical protein
MTAPENRLRIGPECGQLVIRTRREGLAAKAGHDLTIDVTRWSGEVSDAGDASTVSVTVPLDALAVREGSGGALPLTEGNKVEINGQMRRILGTGSAVFRSVRAVPAAGGGTIEGNLALNGVERSTRLTVTRTGDTTYRVTTTVVQTAFGIKPYSGFLGALKLRDDVEVECTVDLSAAAPA